MTSSKAATETAISVADLAHLDEVGTDVFRAPPLATELTRTFGGQVAAQAVAAAMRTAPDRRINSLHAYFLRGGKPDQPVRVTVDRVRDGRSFTTRSVTCWQDDVEIFTMIASFHVGDDGFSHQQVAPNVVSPERISPAGDTELPRKLRAEWALWDQRLVPADDESFPRRRRMWIRYRGEIDDDPTTHLVGLTFISDMGMVTAAHIQHPDQQSTTQNASLDHAVWFHRPARVDEWLLFDQTSPSAESGRAFTTASVFDTSGILVASITQEAMVRRLRTN
ncbi:acyl-CoA thioesterase [Demetria terragena]|uniref:acyl-CoA thioesterase n=1 Tax=Demetria terragena TaxID=63959 RepID=UPI000361A999|nr:acyl-CoA thioesterase domain-containing protein [Demetria terragena]